MAGKIVGLLGAMLFVSAFPAQPQQLKTAPRVALMVPGSHSSDLFRVEAFRRGLREAGYVEGKNIYVEYRYADGKPERWSDLAAELVRLKPDLIVTGGNGVTRAVHEATKTIPIVVGSAGDLLKAGLVTSLARPGGNITGSTEVARDLSAKRLALLKETIPAASRIAILWNSSIVLIQGSATDQQDVREMETVAGRIGVKIQAVDLREPDKFANAYAELVKQQTSAVIFVQGSVTFFHRKQLLELATKHRLPSMCEGSAWADDGCLVSYGPDVTYSWKRAAIFIDKILKGAKPGDIPVEQPTRLELIVNLKAAKALGIKIPQSIVMQATKVIE